MTDFSYLQELEVDASATATCTLSITINGRHPRLIGRFAGEGNSRYWNEVLKSQAKSVKAISKGKITSDMVEEGREQDIGLYPKYVLTGWKDVLSADKKSGLKEVPFSQDACEAFLSALPRRVLAEVTAFFSDPDNFAASSLTVEAVEQKAGN